MKINSRVENIFAQAVAMDNRGLKNTIHCIGPYIFIVNFDHSMMLRFRLRKSEVLFSSPISFNANDYDSSDFDEVDGKIVFNLSEKGYARKKICNLAGYDGEKIKEVYSKYINSTESKKPPFQLSKECCNLLEQELSHIEISSEEGKLLLKQRNIYSGTVIEVSPKDSGFFSDSEALEDFGPYGLKTKDFMSLFAFYNTLSFTPMKHFLVVKENVKHDFDGIMAFCAYDEIINLYKEKEKKKVK